MRMFKLQLAVVAANAAACWSLYAKSENNAVLAVAVPATLALIVLVATRVVYQVRKVRS